MRIRLLIIIICLVQGLGCIGQEKSDTEKRPLESVWFDRLGYAFIIYSDWIESEYKVIRNPYLIEQYKNEVIVKGENECTTPQFHVTIIKNNGFLKSIGVCSPDQLLIPESLSEAFEPVKEIRLKDLTYDQFVQVTDSLSNEGTLWYGSKYRDYVTFRFELVVKNEIENKYEGLLYEANLFEQITKDYPKISQSVDISLSGSGPTKETSNYRIDIQASEIDSSFIKSLDFSKYEGIQSAKFKKMSKPSYTVMILEKLQ